MSIGFGTPVPRPYFGAGLVSSRDLAEFFNVPPSPQDRITLHRVPRKRKRHSTIHGKPRAPAGPDISLAKRRIGCFFAAPTASRDDRSATRSTNRISNRGGHPRHSHAGY